MKKFCITTLIASLVIGAAYAQERVDITSFENADTQEWMFTGGMTSLSFADLMNPDDGVEPHDGQYHMFVEYDTALNQWGTMNLVFPDGPRDLTGMRQIHMWIYFLPDAMEHQDGGFRIRFSLPGGLELGTLQQDGIAGQWAEYVFLIDHLSYENDLSAVDQLQIRINPGGNNVSGICYIDSIYATRPENVPDEYDYIQLWSFDEDEDFDIIPDGWQENGQIPLIGEGQIEPSEGDNYMELSLGGGWTTNGASANAKEVTDRLADAWDVMVDVYLTDEFTASWLNFQLIMQSGGEDAEGNPLSPTSGWDAYGELGIGGIEKNMWHTIAWPVRMENHAGALGEDGWFQFVFSTNQPGDMQGVPLFVDNFRIAVPSSSDVGEWSLF